MRLMDRPAPPRRPSVVAAALLLAPLTACVPLPDLPSVVDTTAILTRGEYIVRDVAVCGHCHAAEPERNPDGPLTGGMAFRNWRLGVIRASNLTPDSVTGLGEWTEAEIVRAIRTGEDGSGGVLAPIMPYRWFHGMSDRDALAVAIYLKSLEAVESRVESDPNLVFEAAKILFLGPETAPGGTAPVPGATPEYGRYLANSVALCADCHTPRTGLLSTPDTDRLFAGQTDPPAGFPANPANLTPDSATGIGKWSEDEFVRTIETGVNPRGDSLHAFMPWRQYRRMADDDLRAIYRYLRTLPPIEHRVPRGGEPADARS